MARKVILTQIVILIVMMFAHIPTLHAKRLAPKKIPPVKYNGIEYRVMHWGFENGTNINGGYIEAKRLSDNKKLWGHHIYKIEKKSSLEADMQDVFISAMILLPEKNCLQVTNERNETFLVKLETGEVQKNNLS